MPKKLEHIGIAVTDLEASEKLFTKLLGVAPYKRELVESEMVMTSFFILGDIKFELLSATHPDSTIAKFIIWPLNLKISKKNFVKKKKTSFY